MSYDLPVTILGRTGLAVTRLGIGGAYCETVDGYRAALDCGVNYVDTARVYRDGKDKRSSGKPSPGRERGSSFPPKATSATPPEPDRTWRPPCACYTQIT